MMAALSLGSNSQFSSGGGNPPPPFNPPSIRRIVNQPLTGPEDFLTWRQQFIAHLIAHNLLGLVDGSFPPPPMVVTDTSGQSQPNPLFYQWLRADQQVRSWLYATVSKEINREIRLSSIPI
jgi:hypothetical protein